MGGVPSVPTDPSRTVQVIGTGYSRTGTVSMALALEKLLDGPVMHGGTQLFGREDSYIKLWCDILRNRHDRPVLLRLLREATAGFVAITDAPGAMFLPELLELYPDAQVVLVTRDPERWFRSMEPILRQASVRPWLLRCLLFPCPSWRWAPTWLNYMGQREAERFHTDFGKDRLIEHDYVRAVVPPAKLLTMDLGQGWAPPAAFLGRPVPDAPFPRANDSQAAMAVGRRIFRTASLTWLAILGGLAASAWGASWCLGTTAFGQTLRKCMHGLAGALVIIFTMRKGGEAASFLLASLRLPSMAWC